MDGKELREATKIIADLTKAGFTPEEIAVFMDSPYTAYSTEMGKIGVLVMLQRGMKERKLVKQIGNANYVELWDKGLIHKPFSTSTDIHLTDAGRKKVMLYAIEREQERNLKNGMSLV